MYMVRTSSITSVHVTSAANMTLAATAAAVEQTNRHAGQERAAVKGHPLMQCEDSKCEHVCACAQEVTCFVLAGERQTNRLRAKYLTAVVR